MCAWCASVCCILVCWCVGVSSPCSLPHFSLNLSYTGSWNHKLNHRELQDRPWNISIQNTSLSVNGDQMFSIIVELTAPALGKDCKPNTVKKYYNIHSDKKNWGDAMDACAEEDAHLVVIDSQREEEDVIEMIVKADTTRWVHWVGFHDHFKEGDYTTVFNKKLEYVSWAPGEPGGNPTLNCGFFIFTNSTEYGMADGNCKQLYRYICERSTPALGYDSATREKNISEIQANSPTVNQEKNSLQNQEITSKPDQNPSAIQGSNPPQNQENNQPDSQHKNTQKNQVENQPANKGKDPLANQNNQVKNKEEINNSDNHVKHESLSEVQDQSASDDNSTGRWHQNPSTGYYYVPKLGHYKLHDISERRSWHDAHATCAREGSHLLIINSELEERIIKTLIEISHTKGRLHWIGFHDQYKERKYITVCNETLDYTNWYPGRPEGSKQLNCGYYLYHNATHSGLADGDCIWSGPFICEDESVEKRPAITQSGYLKAPGDLGYYKKYKDLKNFQDANNACAVDGSHLIIINNVLEERVMMALAGKGSHWVGIHDYYIEGKYVTVFNDTLRSTGYTRWYPGDPNNVEWIEEDCIVFTYQTKTRRGLADLNCEEKLPFVCEFDLVKCPRKS